MHGKAIECDGMCLAKRGAHGEEGAHGIRGTQGIGSAHGKGGVHGWKVGE
jgi:hypothetical protein